LVLGALSLLLPLVVTVAIFLDDRAVREIHALFDGYSNRRFFSQTQSILLPLLLLPLFATRATQNMRRASWVLCTGFWVLAFAVGTRAFYVATLAGAVFAWWFSPAAGRAWVKMQA
ncbi:MAG: hypothetical protein VW257_08815, partial [Quisquiliibacterium sp.]